ncbi:MAG TPA: VCBS repeat-containing protein, partial [Polyangiaceae bacterium]
SDNTAFSFPSPQPCVDTGDNGCYTNFLSLVDIDQDGDFDILEANGGGLFQPGTAEESVIYGNDGRGAFVDLTAAASATSFGNPHIQGRQVAAGDIDGDGDIDIYQPGGYGTDLDKLWVQTQKGVFQDHAATQLPTALMSHASAVKFGDIDGDGDLDLLVADWGTGLATDTGRLILYTNDGTGVFTLLETEHDSAAVTASDTLPPTIPPASTTGVYGLRPTDIDFADVDGDYDLDILVNNRQGYSRILLNDGKGKFTDATGFVPTFAADGVTVASATSNYPPKVGPYANNQELCDLDEDGDLDIVLDSAGPKPAAVTSGNVSQILINNGSGVFTDDTSNRVLSEPGTEDNVVRCADINADGHYDLVVGGRTSTSEKLLLNDGTGKFSYSDVLAKLPSADTTLAIGVGDLNGDGKIDLVTGQGEGTIAAGNATTLRLNHVYLNSASAADTTPPVFRKLQTPTPAVGVDTVFYMAVRDSATNDAGQMVKSVAVSYVAKTVAKTSTKTAAAVWVGGDLFRVVVPAQVDGTQLTLTPTVTDRVGLVTSAPAMVFQLGTPLPVAQGGAGGQPSTTPVEAGAGGSAGSEIGEAGSGGVAGTVSDAGSSGDKGGAGGKSGGGSGGTVVAAGDEGGEAGEAPTGGAGKPAASGSSDDGGCSFTPAPSTNSHGAVLLGFGLAMFGLARRRRTQK